MNCKSTRKSTLIAFATLGMMGIPALAGPPLVCHRLEIGSAKSLPWGTDPASWNQPLGDYDVAHLADETVSLLSPQTPVLVRMETLRRAAIYAGHSPEAAQSLIVKLRARAEDAPLAMFDYGYLVEVVKELSWTDHGSELSNVAEHLDGYPWITRSLAASGDDPEMEFAAALVVLGRRDLKSHHEHAQKALSGGRTDPLLARNLATFFSGTSGDTMAVLLNKEH